MPQSLLIHYYCRNAPGFCSTILRKRKRNLFYCATRETSWNPAPAYINNPNHSSWRTLSPTWNDHSFLLRRWTEVSAEVWLEKATFFVFLCHHLPACSSSCFWVPFEKPLAGKVIKRMVCCKHVLVLRIGSWFINSTSITFSCPEGLKKKNKETKQTKKPLSYLHPWGTKLNFAVTPEWISKIHRGRRKGGTGERARVLEVGSLERKERLRRRENWRSSVSGRGPADIRMLQGIIGVTGLSAGLEDPSISCSLFHYSQNPQGHRKYLQPTSLLRCPLLNYRITALILPLTFLPFVGSFLLR